MEPLRVPVVAFHGFLGAPSLWDRTRALLPSWSIEARRLPGHGPSPWVQFKADFSRVVDLLADTIPEKALLVGYSFGARIALSLLARHPERFSGVVSFSGHLGLEDNKERAARVVWDDEQAASILRDGVPAFAERWRSLPLFATQRTLPESVLLEQHQARLAHQAPGLAWAMRTLGLGRMPSCWHALTPHASRVFLVSGVLDTKFASLMDQASARLGAAHRSVEGVGHNIPLESPESAAELLRGGAEIILGQKSKR